MPKKKKKKKKKEKKKKELLEGQYHCRTDDFKVKIFKRGHHEFKANVLTIQS
jgi:hypothetical protein